MYYLDHHLKLKKLKTGIQKVSTVEHIIREVKDDDQNI